MQLFRRKDIESVETMVMIMILVTSRNDRLADSHGRVPGIMKIAVPYRFCLVAVDHKCMIVVAAFKYHNDPVLSVLQYLYKCQIIYVRNSCE